MRYDRDPNDRGYYDEPEHEEPLEDEHLAALELAWTCRAVLNDDDLLF